MAGSRCTRSIVELSSQFPVPRHLKTPAFNPELRCTEPELGDPVQASCATELNPAISAPDPMIHKNVTCLHCGKVYCINIAKVYHLR